MISINGTAKPPTIIGAIHRYTLVYIAHIPLAVSPQYLTPDAFWLSVACNHPSTPTQMPRFAVRVFHAFAAFTAKYTTPVRRTKKQLNSVLEIFIATRVKPICFIEDVHQIGVGSIQSSLMNRRYLSVKAFGQTHHNIHLRGVR